LITTKEHDDTGAFDTARTKKFSQKLNQSSNGSASKTAATKASTIVFTKKAEASADRKVSAFTAAAYRPMSRSKNIIPYQTTTLNSVLINSTIREMEVNQRKKDALIKDGQTRCLSRFKERQDRINGISTIQEST
jgi:hypothetical protein